MGDDREALYAEIERLLQAKGLTLADLTEALLQLPVVDPARQSPGGRRPAQGDQGPSCLPRS